MTPRQKTAALRGFDPAYDSRGSIGHDGMSALSPFYPQLRTLVDAAGHGSFVLIREVAIGLPHLMPERYGRCGRRAL